MLDGIVVRTGLGKVYDEPRHGQSRPQCTWRISTKDDCLALTKLLDRAPSQTLKLRDYVMWRRAVYAWHVREPHHGGRYGRSIEGDDWSEMALLFDEIKAVRAYRSDGIEQTSKPLTDQQKPV